MTSTQLNHRNQSNHQQPSHPINNNNNQQQQQQQQQHQPINLNNHYYWLIQSIGYSYSIHSFNDTNTHTIALSLTIILFIQSILTLLLPPSLPTKQSIKPQPLTISAILILLDHFFLLYSISKLSPLSIILITTCSSKWSPSISRFLTSITLKPWFSSTQPTLDHTPPGLLAIAMLLGCFTIDHYISPHTQSDPNRLLIGYLCLFAHLVFRGFQLSNQSSQQNPRQQQSIVITATAFSLILNLASFLLPFSQTVHHPSFTFIPTHLGSWMTGLAVYSIINHLLSNQAWQVTRKSNSSDTDDLLSLMMIRMLSCELTGTLAFDHPMGNMPDRLIGLVSYLAIGSILPSSSTYMSFNSSPQQLQPMDIMSRFFKRARSVINTILANPESRNIYFFLCLNLAFMFIQMTYGIWTNSLGLISDSIHMFFDCMALGMGLFASVMATWPADKQFTYGYGRVETLSGFANGIFLMLISTFIVFEAVQRLIDPPEMNTNQLLVVSFVGLMVNLVGMFATGHHHHHHGHSHDHSHDHGHSHNMKGVFLHVMADTLGSVGVIISTLLIERYGWTGFDPIASIFIALLIFASVVPLVLDSAKILLLCLDDDKEKEVRKALGKLTSIEGLSSYSAPRFWPQDGNTIVGSVHLQLSPSITRPDPSTTTTMGIGLESPLMMLEEQEELFASYTHANRVLDNVQKTLATQVPSLVELHLQLEGIDGSKHCFCLTGPNS